MLVSRWRSTDTWLKTADGWKLIGEQTMAVLEDPPATSLANNLLCSYSGVYQLTPEITEEIRCDGDHLTGQRTGRPMVTYKAEVADVFFAPGKPRTRRIFLHENGIVSGFVDRREGIDITWKRTK
jgi:hypothetical protein